MDGFVRMVRRSRNWFYHTLACMSLSSLHHPLTSRIQLQQLPFTGQPYPTLLSSPPIPEDPNYKWPPVIFSHGVGRGRLMHSAFCGEMASRSYVVYAVKHRELAHVQVA